MITVQFISQLKSDVDDAKRRVRDFEIAHAGVFQIYEDLREDVTERESLLQTAIISFAKSSGETSQQEAAHD